jgi:hypothetical protein
MSEDLITDGAPTTDAGLGDGGDNAAQSGVSVKDILGATLGKTFQSDEAALKAVKDTFSYVGMKKEDILKSAGLDTQQMGASTTSTNKEANAVDTSQFISKEQYEQDMFFSKNPELEAHKDLLRGLAVANGVSIKDAAELPSFKNVFEKASAYDKAQKSRSVLETNPRLGQVTDHMSKAKELSAAGNRDAAAEAATKAVLESLGL